MRKPHRKHRKYKAENFITYTLKQEGFPCLTAGNAQGALSQLVSNPVDLMLLDLGLPDFDGMEVIKKVRGWSEVPIIVVSARDQENEKAAALDGGADDYLTKPFSATELMTRIRVALRHSRRTSVATQRPNTAWAGCPSIRNGIWYFWTGRSCM